MKRKVLMSARVYRALAYIFKIIHLAVMVSESRHKYIYIKDARNIRALAEF